MRFALLGPVQVLDNDSPVEIRGALRRTLLAALLLHRGSVVSADRLGDMIWGERPPVSVTTSLYNQIMRLRQTLGDDAERIRAVAPGYLIHVEPDELDLDEFTRLCAQARQAAAEADWPRSAARYAAALALWRGEMLVDVPTLQDHASIHQFTEDRLVALQGRIEADLNLGRHDELIGELRTLTASHPLREAFHAQLMLALYRAGRQADALAVYRDLRRATVDELGVEPGAVVQAMHADILDSAPSLSLPKQSADAAGSVAAAPPRHTPRQLPADARLFAGRAAELDELVALAGSAKEGGDTGMFVISAINGMAGIGKTALAVRSGHRLAERFPDGQLFIDLRGYDAKLPPLGAEDALDYLLRSLGIEPRAIPADPDERAALYRSRLAGTRTMIVLDNAANTAQVLPLLPGTSGCLVLITSRNRMMGLDDAHFFALGALNLQEALTLLRMVAGRGRIAADESAERELVELCAMVPLAVRIVAARLRHGRGTTVAGLVEELRAEPGRMDGLRDDERNLAAVFESSYRSLAGPEARLFRLLGLLPGPDVDAYAAANLLGAPLADADRLLVSLLDQNLLVEHAVGRYRMHDLLRAYARGLGTSEREERECVDRLLDYYEFTARVAADRLARRVRPPSARREEPPGVIRELPDDAESVAWTSAELGNLLAFLEQVSEPRRLVSLTAALASVLGAELPKSRQIGLHEAAVAAARDLGRASDRAEALLNLAHVYRTDGNFDHAAELLGAAVDAYGGIGDKLGEANALVELGRVTNLTGKHAGAAEIHERALALYHELGDRLGEADALYELSRIDALIGESARGEARAAEALTVFRELGKTLGVAQVQVVLANLRRRAGDFAEAAELLESSAAVFREVGNKQNESNVLWTLGQIRLAQGDLETAAALLERTLALSREVGTRHGIASGLGVLGTVRLAQGDLPAATALLRDALTMFEAIGHRTGAASAQMYLAKAKHRSGEPEAALELLGCAIAAYEQAGDEVALAEAWTLMGAIVADTTGAEAALTWYRKALNAARGVDASALQAEALEGVARCLAEADRPQAVEAQQEAVAIYQRLAVPEVARAQAYLTELTGLGASTEG